MSNRTSLLLFTALAIVGTSHGLRGPLIDFSRNHVLSPPKARRTAQKETNTMVVDVEIVHTPVVSERTAPSSGTAANRLALIKSLQGGLARVFEVVPKPLLYAITAVVSGLLFFEMSRFVALFSVPVLIVLGARESMLEDKMEFTDALSEADQVGRSDVAVGTEAVVRQSINSKGEQVQPGDRLNEISMRVADAQASMTDARTAASSLKDRISSFQERLKDLNLGY